MRFIIDGYNVIRTLPRYIKIQVKDEKLTLISLLKKHKLIGKKKHESVIFFDGYDDFKHSLKNKYFKIIFSKNVTADELIKSVVEYSNKPQDIYVVTDDREIRDFVYMIGAKVITIKEFADALSLPNKNIKKGSDFEEKIDETNARKITEEFHDIWKE